MRIYETLFKSRSITRKIDTIVVHCAATSITSDVTTEDIARWHIHDRHFRDIGYHYIVDKLGIIHLGRPLNEMGAHCKGHNAHSIGICYIGGLDAQGNPADTRTPLQQLAIKQLIGLLVNEFKIYDVYGHRDLSPDVNGDGQITSVDWVKMCPCYDAHQEWLQYLKEMAIVARNYGQARMGMVVNNSIAKSSSNSDEMTLHSSSKSGEVPCKGGEVGSNSDSDLSEEDIALMNLCEAAEDYLGVVYGEGEERSSEPSSDADCEYDPVKHDNASFSAVINPNDANPVPPVPDELSGAESMGKISLGGWRGMNWRGWGVRGKGWLRN